MSPRKRAAPRPAVRADTVQVGDMVRLRTGAVTVLRIEAAHGGLEMLVRSDGRKGSQGLRERLLWFYVSQPVDVTRGVPSCEVPTSPGRAISRREALRASWERRKSQKEQGAL